MPEDAVRRPVRELDLTHEFGAHPERIGGVGSRHAVERSPRHPQRFQAGQQVAEDAVREARAHTTDVAEVAALRDREEERAESALPLALPRADADDHRLLHAGVLELEPGRRALAGTVP
ncbi:Uncharacterised protein [Mycobacterium tuberculosis]|nr:Uncharacterised protein [Mycobacterium tuberculosis]